MKPVFKVVRDAGPMTPDQIRDANIKNAGLHYEDIMGELCMTIADNAMRTGHSAGEIGRLGRAGDGREHRFDARGRVVSDARR